MRQAIASLLLALRDKRWVVGIGICLALVAGCSGPKLTEEDAIQLVTGYLELKTYSRISISGIQTQNSCEDVLSNGKELRASWSPDEKVWEVTTWLASGEKWLSEFPSYFEWIVFERTLVVEPVAREGLGPNPGLMPTSRC